MLRSYTDATYTYVQYENRFTFAKVEESTTYTVAVRQLSSDQTLYKDSEWGTVTLTSAAAPDMTDVLFYEDFNDLWWSGDYVNLSYGPQLKSFNNALSAYTVEEDDFAAACTVTYPAGNMTDVGGPTTANDAYRNAYWSPWSEEWSLLAAAGKALGYLTKVYPCTGCVKYGTGSANGVLSIPRLTSLTSATDVTLTFDVWPYVIPSATAGLNVTATEGLQVTVYIESGAGTIEGGTDNAIVLDNTNPATNGSSEAGCFLPTHHAVTIKGIDATTRIAIASGDQPKYVGSKNRIWLDNLKVTKN